MLKDLTSEGLVRLNIDAKNWQEAIQKSADALLQNGKITHAYIDAIIKAYSLYQQQVIEQDTEVEPVLSMTRAWTLVRFVESKMLKLKSCTCCGGEYIVNTYDLNQNYVCNLCHVPSRAGKTKKAKELTYNLVSMTA